jgi:hypothetical protein
VLGESVIQLVEPNIANANTTRVYWYFTAGLILIFTFALLYCDSVLREDLTRHAMNRSPLAGGLWVWMHPVLGFSMFIIGVSIKLSFESVVHRTPVANEHNFMLGLSCGCTLLFLMLMRGTHKGGISTKRKSFTVKSVKRLGNYLIRLMFAMAHFIVASQSNNDKIPGPDDPVDIQDKYLFIHAALASLSVLIELLAAHIGRANKSSGKEITLSSLTGGGDNSADTQSTAKTTGEDANKTEENKAEEDDKSVHVSSSGDNVSGEPVAITLEYEENPLRTRQSTIEHDGSMFSS